jgi:hypothetical protein
MPEAANLKQEKIYLAHRFGCGCPVESCGSQKTHVVQPLEWDRKGLREVRVLEATLLQNPWTWEDCYGLDVTLGPKGPCAEGLVSSLVLLGGGGSFRVWGLLEGPYAIGDVPQRRLWEPDPLLFSTFDSICNYLHSHIAIHTRRWYS